MVEQKLRSKYFKQEEMHCLKTITQYEITIAYLKSNCKKVIVIKSLNTCSLILHFQDIC
jgi:hypothetical protein